MVPVLSSPILALMALHKLFPDESMHSAILLSGPGLHYIHCFPDNYYITLIYNISAAEKKGFLGRGRSGTSAQSFVLCFSVF